MNQFLFYCFCKSTLRGRTLLFDFDHLEADRGKLFNKTFQQVSNPKMNILIMTPIPWSSLVEGDEGSFLPKW